MNRPSAEKIDDAWLVSRLAGQDELVAILALLVNKAFEPDSGDIMERLLEDFIDATGSAPPFEMLSLSEGEIAIDRVVGVGRRLAQPT